MSQFQSFLAIPVLVATFALTQNFCFLDHLAFDLVQKLCR